MKEGGREGGGEVFKFPISTLERKKGERERDQRKRGREG